MPLAILGTVWIFLFIFGVVFLICWCDSKNNVFSAEYHFSFFKKLFFICLLLFILLSSWIYFASFQYEVSEIKEYKVVMIGNIASIEDDKMINLNRHFNRNFTENDIIIKKIYKSKYIYGILFPDSSSLSDKE